ncbi:MAG: hypothetical protein KatS3mg004_0617 [Bryobacteraceae bacterium]|nr:MAG: hypothetical protein KatS3mg004_0617 [Bryobacteraceae bacterium]
MTRWRLWKDKATVWLFATLIQAAIAVIRFIRRRESPDGGETR